jgi:hypothetical protein
MNARPLWHVLVMDWTAVENTPPLSRRPLEMQRWHFRVERLATMLDRPAGELVRELKDEAKNVARRQRREIEASLAEDLAVSKAQGKPVNPPWRRRLRDLADISGQSPDVVRERVAAAAESIQVVDAR